MTGVRLGGALLLSLSMSLPLQSQGGGDLTANPVQPTWWQKLIGTKTTKKPEQSPTKQPLPSAQPKDLAPMGNPAPTVQRGVDRDQELNAFFRRQAVADQLMEVALRKNDTDLMRRAELLHKRNFEVLRSKIAVFGGMSAPLLDEMEQPSPRKSDLPPNLEQFEDGTQPESISNLKPRGIDR